MNKLTITVVSIVTLAIAGCVTSSKKLDQIHLGMSKAQVIEVLGNPKSTSARQGSEILRYQLSGRDAPVLNPNGYQFADGYTVQLIDNKVVAYGRDDEFQAITVRQGPPSQ